MWTESFVFLVLLNGYEFFLVGLDKWLAVNQRPRISEANLLLTAFLGGSPAAFLACRFFRHKYRKNSFMSRLRWIAAAQSLYALWRVYVAFRFTVTRQ